MAAHANEIQRPALGMSSFAVVKREQWGRSIRVAMALVSDSGDAEVASADELNLDVEKATHAEDNQAAVAAEKRQRTPLPTDQSAIRQLLKALLRDQTASLADQIELLVRFDDLQGWQASGFKHCVAWINSELGISGSLGWEYLRVGRELRKLRTLTALFRSGNLTWSKVRLISRVANEESELLLCHAALDASVSDVARICNDFRWDKESVKDAERTENERALQQYEARALTWRRASNGNTEFRLSLPPERAASFLRGIEHCVDQLQADGNSNNAVTDKRDVSQERADAASLMAERSLLFSGNNIASADRYLVVVNTVAAGLAQQSNTITPDLSDTQNQTQAKESTPDPIASVGPSVPDARPTVQGTGPIARETARRLACDASLISITSKDGEPLDISRKSRQWTPAMSRAIHHRDQHCQWPGCTVSRHLHIHHIKHWVEGGGTSVENGVLCCQYHHILLHEGGYRFQRNVALHSKLDSQFKSQTTRLDGADQCDEEITLRHNRASFEAVRKLLSRRYRFSVITPEGKVFNHQDNVESSIDSTRVESSTSCADQVSEPSAQYHVAKVPAAIDTHDADKTDTSVNARTHGSCVRSASRWLKQNRHFEFPHCLFDASRISIRALQPSHRANGNLIDQASQSYFSPCST